MKTVRYFPAIALLALVGLVLFFVLKAIRPSDSAAVPLDHPHDNHSAGANTIDGEPLPLDTPSRSEPRKHGEASGTLHLVADDGQTFTDTYGQLVFNLEEFGVPGVPRELEVSVAAGAWSIVAARGAVINLVRATIFGRKCTVSPVRFSVHETKIDLQARFERGPVLRVVDRNTGQDLADIVIERCALDTAVPSYPMARPQPSAATLLQRSPIQLPAGVGTDAFWVGASGYAWEQVVISYPDTGDRCIALEAHTSADILLEGLRAGGQCNLQITYDDGPSQLKHGARSPERLISVPITASVDSPLVPLDLPRGTWFAQVEGLTPTFGFASPSVAFSTNAAIRSTVVLECAEILSGPTGIVNVRLLVDEGNPAVEGCLLRKRQVERTRDLSAPRQYHGELTSNQPGMSAILNARFKDVSVGTYTLVVLPMQWTEALDVAEVGGTTLQVYVPPPTRHQIVFMDAMTQRPIVPFAALWSAAESGSFQPLEVQPNEGAMLVNTAAACVNVLVSANNGDIPTEVRASLRDPTVPTVVLLSSQATVTVEVEHQGSTVPMRSSWWDRVRFSLEGEPANALTCAVTSRGPSPFAYQARYHLARAGTYSIRLPPILEFDGEYEESALIVIGNDNHVVFQVTSSACR